MRSALAMLGQSTTTLDASMSQWQAVTSTNAGAPLQANRTVTNAAYGVEYHVWPAAAAAVPVRNIGGIAQNGPLVP